MLFFFFYLTSLFPPFRQSNAFSVEICFWMTWWRSQAISLFLLLFFWFCCLSHFILDVTRKQLFQKEDYIKINTNKKKKGNGGKLSLCFGESVQRNIYTNLNAVMFFFFWMNCCAVAFMAGKHLSVTWLVSDVKQFNHGLVVLRVRLLINGATFLGV